MQDSDPMLFNNTSYQILRLATNLQRDRDYAVRITLLGNPIGSPVSTVNFEGIWLSKGGYLRSTQYTQASPRALLHQEANIEVISALPLSRVADAVSAYPVILASVLNISHSLVTTRDHCLSDVCPRGHPSIQSLYFRTGQPNARSFGPVHQHQTPLPTALIFSLGLSDFHHILDSDHSNKEVSKYIDSFVRSYAAFVTTIRSASQTTMMPMSPAQQSMAEVDASYVYNSAPSTLPIFLLTPFTPNQRLRRRLGHGVSAVVRALQGNGDKATIWLDTEGWLSSQDFRTPHDSDQSTEDLTEAGHAKAAAYLSSHLCSYLKTDCNFFKHDTLRGNLYVPSEAGMGKLLEERKIALIKDTMSMS